MKTDWITGEPLAANEAIREIGKKSKAYASMTESEKQAFHTEVYAFRKIHLGIQEETSPCDPNGEWFNSGAVERLTRAKYTKREQVKRDRRTTKDAELQREGRAIVNKWAQDKGFLDLDDYCRAHKTPDGKALPWVDVYTAIMQEICANTPHESGILFPPRIGSWRSFAHALGGPTQDDDPQKAAIRARSIREAAGIPDFNPSPEEMAASRKRLGIREPEDTDK